jgi:predicted alpha/beta-hydrolase family hydrolase
MLAHIAGIPVEETALSFAPIAFAAAGLAGARLRRLAAQRRSTRLRRDGGRETLGVRA